MKKWILPAILILSLLLVPGCGLGGGEEEQGTESESPMPTEASPSSASPETSSPEPQTGSLKDYFPIRENIRYVYEGKGNEYAPYVAYTDFTSDKKMQQRKITGGTVMANVVEIGDDKVTRTLSLGEIYYRENLLEKKGASEEILLMMPLEKGTAWTLRDLSSRSITDTAAVVTTPMGIFKALEVTTKRGGDKTLDYYAKDIGLIKSVFLSGGAEISSTLAKVEKDTPFKQSIAFYYPSGTDEKIYYKNKEVSFKTNDKTAEVLEKAYKEVINENFGRVLSENTKINSLSLDQSGMVNIDLSKEFTGEMNAGAAFEGMILQSLTNTFGRYYGAEKVILTIDGKPYESGHIVLKKGEFLKVKYEGTVEMK